MPLRESARVTRCLLTSAQFLLQDEDFQWPTLQEAIDFRSAVYKVVVGLIATMPDPSTTPLSMDSPYWALVMGFEHERIHLETSSVLIHQLPISAVQRPKGWQYGPTFSSGADSAPLNSLLDIAAGTAAVGKPKDFPTYGWDNEYGKRVVSVPAFKASKFLVSNAEFLPFVLAGGYKAKQYWVSPAGDDEGWRWVQFRNATHPCFWVATKDMPEHMGGKEGLPHQKDDGSAEAGEGHDFKLRTMFDIVPMPWDWPAEVNYLEARAFLNWRQERDGCLYRMPTEAEYHLLRDDPVPHTEASTGTAEGAMAGGGVAGCTPLLLAPGIRAMEGEDAAGHPAVTYPGTKGTADAESARVDVILQDRAPGNVNMRFGSSTPVNMFPPSPTGAFDTHGNVWEWAEDHFGPLPEFSIHYLYDDFSTPCFDGWHTMILGGSWVSTGDQASNFARYAFRRHFFQHLGFRYVQREACDKEAYPGEATVTNLWEGHGALSQELTDGYAPQEQRLPKLSTASPLQGYTQEEPGTLLGNAAKYPSLLAEAVHRAYAGAVGGDGSPTASSQVPASKAKVLHLGCRTGGTTLQLCKYFGQVVGVDAHEPFIRHARVIQHHGQLTYQRIAEGVLSRTETLDVPQHLPRQRAVYVLNELHELEEEVTAHAPYDVVVLDRVLDEHVQPLALAKLIPRLVRAGGKVVVASANNWDASVTPRNSWLGGFCMNGEDFDTVTMLQHTWKKSLALQHALDLPRLTQQHLRQFVLQVVQVSVWQPGTWEVPASGSAAGDAEAAAAAAAVANGGGDEDGDLSLSK